MGYEVCGMRYVVCGMRYGVLYALQLYYPLNIYGKG